MAYISASSTFKDNCIKFSERLSKLENEAEYPSNKLTALKRGRILFGAMEFAYEEKNCCECETTLPLDRLYLIPAAQYLPLCYCEDCHRKKFHNSGWPYRKDSVKELVSMFPNTHES